MSFFPEQLNSPKSFLSLVKVSRYFTVRIKKYIRRSIYISRFCNFFESDYENKVRYVLKDYKISHSIVHNCRSSTWFVQQNFAISQNVPDFVLVIRTLLFLSDIFDVINITSSQQMNDERNIVPRWLVIDCTLSILFIRFSGFVKLCRCDFWSRHWHWQQFN